ncbi:MAG: ATP synthase F0 subunit C, partial [bacterium]
MKLKIINMLIITLILLTLLSLGYANDIAPNGILPTSMDYNKFIKSISIIGLGVAAGLGGVGIGLLSRSFIEGIYRNPETTNRMLIWYFVAFALIEAQVLYTL